MSAVHLTNINECDVKLQGNTVQVNSCTSMYTFSSFESFSSGHSTIANQDLCLICLFSSSSHQQSVLHTGFSLEQTAQKCDIAF